LEKHKNVRFYQTAATARREGFRACKRCRPDTVPGSPEWDARADAVGRAMRLIADGVVDREGVAALAEGWRPWRAYGAQHLWASLEVAAPSKKPARREVVA
jgi:methylphosphotriester-DNA--protein-cysteine methyltransferase